MIILLILLYISKIKKEGFVNAYCQNYKDCTSCADASGCAWCPKMKACLDSTTLKSTDPNCNQMTTVRSAFLCSANLEDKIPPKKVVQDDILYDYALYKNRITDKIPPPNLYMSGKMKVSNEDLLSNANDVRNDIKNLHTELPGIIASAVENNIKPMVKGILSQNYYIQGFEDMNPLSKKKI
jgi:hypothetical protein